MKTGSLASTWAILGATKCTVICFVGREIPDSQPSRDSNDTLWEVQIGRRHYLRRRSELRPLQGALLKGRR